jgi:hypothetical protein
VTDAGITKSPLGYGITHCDAVTQGMPYRVLKDLDVGWICCCDDIDISLRNVAWWMTIRLI